MQGCVVHEYLCALACSNTLAFTYTRVPQGQSLLDCEAFLTDKQALFIAGGEEEEDEQDEDEEDDEDDMCDGGL